MAKIPTFPYRWTEGDNLPEMAGSWTGKDLSGYTITLRVDRPTTVLTKTATAVDLPNGLFKFTWDDADLVAGDDQLAKITFTDSSSKDETTVFFKLDVEKAIS